ncbi:MAG: hypothetical protein R2688_05080 [Fimbriimonadaceae bacterium]
MIFNTASPNYDAKYPDGIPTSVKVKSSSGAEFDSGLVMYPAGHARNTACDLKDILAHKWQLMAEIALPDGADAAGFVSHLESLESLDSYGIASLYDFELAERRATKTKE